MEGWRRLAERGLNGGNRRDGAGPGRHQFADSKIPERKSGGRGKSVELGGRRERKQKKKSEGAIASELEAKIYNLEILKKNVEDESGNVTRFFVMGNDPKHPEFRDKKYITSCIFKLKSIPAALYKALGGFATNGVNLCKLESFSVKNTFEIGRAHV